MSTSTHSAGALNAREHIERALTLIMDEGHVPIMVAEATRHEGHIPNGACVVFRTRDSTYISYRWGIREDGVAFLYQGFYDLGMEQAIRDAAWRVVHGGYAPEMWRFP